MANSVTGDTNFTFEYVFSIIVIIVVCTLVMKKNPNMNTFIVLLLGLLVGWITLFALNNFFPYFTQFFSDLINYFKFEILNNFTSMGYTHIWPPILAILIVFIVLLYNRNLG